MTATSTIRGYPRAGAGGLKRAIGRALLRAGGWRIEGDLPELPRFVICVGPHTSNWDFVVGYAAKMALELHASWLGKHTLFQGPQGRLLRWMGGIPVDRRAAHGVVEQAAEWFRRSPAMVLAVTPEGTRRKVDRWRLGFYHIARLADVPIVPVALDWGPRVIRIGTPVQPMDDQANDIDHLLSFFRAVHGRHPERAFPPAAGGGVE